jgi:Tfp pilus assembly protein PilF
MAGVAGIYSDANIPDKAEEYYRQALSLEPENPIRMNNLAWLLIDKDRNVEEGMELIDKALNLSPDDYLMIDTKGWGFYKQGRYKEALEILERSWELKPVYEHEVYLHLEAAKKAVAGQKNN